MDSGNGETGGENNGRLQELIQTRSKLLQEKAELLKKRKQALILDISKLERDQQAMPKLPAAASRAGAQESTSSFDGIFGQPVSQENMSRRSLINNIFTGVAVTVGGIGVLGVLLAPGIEKLAYLSFASIFEEGAIYLTRQTEKVLLLYITPFFRLFLFGLGTVLYAYMHCESAYASWTGKFAYIHMLCLFSFADMFL
jgi:hypothetical protein